jgi:PAS domain S-box-containing protein
MSFETLLNSGMQFSDVPSEKRNIRLTNSIAIGLVFIIALLNVLRILYFGFHPIVFYTLAVNSALVAAPILVNRLGYTTLSRILLCWTFQLIIIWNVRIVLLIQGAETSSYIGFRIFQVAFACLPMLVFNLADWKPILIGFSVPVVLMVFYNPILTMLGVGYESSGLHEASYYYNSFRTFIAVLVIAWSLFSLKKIIEKQEGQNMALIEELNEKNNLIQLNSERALKKAYERLSYHINNTPLAVIERDKNFTITFWNKRAEELFGWSSGEVLGKRPVDFMVHADDQANASKIMEEYALEKRESSFMEIRTVAKDGTVLHCLWYYSFLRDENGELETILSFVSDVTEQRRANYFLKERIKELRTLYNVSLCLTTSEKSMHDVFTDFPFLLPPGWQYPEVCHARLKVFDVYYQTPDFKEGKSSQRTKISVNGEEIGFIEVVYLEDKPDVHEGPFFNEERELLVAVAGMLQVYIERKLEEEKLLRAQANLSATINNTEIIIWSVDNNFKLITYNEPFRKYAREHYNEDLSKGTNEYFHESLRLKWRERYSRVLTGEVLTLEESLDKNDFRFSLSPIIDNAHVIGVSIFGDNITEQNKRNRELAEANKKITEFKVMALRSVMNPHFIFNVLSSIQYFITRNDELNAINYLTSFSKLMRTVLTRSVADFVTLKEELDLLKDYVHLEKLRFEDKFDFRIVCDDSIDADEVQMPSLLIQPYVENAILHGLYNKDGKGSLAVYVKKADDFLLFEIEDDGIGREAAMKIRERNQTQRKSMGTQLTEERLKMLNSDAHDSVTYTDLFDADAPAGTRVTIRIKINPN